MDIYDDLLQKEKQMIFLDMDGVLADWEKTARELVGENWKEEVEKPNWGGLYNYPDLFARLDPMEDALELYDACVSISGAHRFVQILTALPNRAHFKDAARHKIEWARKYIHPNIRVNFGPRAQDKQYHYMDGDVLIDDKQLNIDQWRAKGGLGILHTSARESIILLTSR